MIGPEIMTIDFTHFNERTSDDDCIDFSVLNDTRIDTASSRQGNTAKAGLRQVIDVYLEEKKLRNELRDIFEEDFK
jgi:hypothetical protein